MLFAVGDLYLLYKAYKTKKKKTPLSNNIQSSSLTELPYVTVQIPLYNEGNLLSRALNHIARLDYPKDKLHIQVLDDSDDKSQYYNDSIVREYQQKNTDIDYIHRAERSGYKAGALKEALPYAKGEFIAIFDVDFTPAPDFLYSLLPYFSKEDIGCVQSRWTYQNANASLITKAQTVLLNSHFCVAQPGRESAGFFLNFNGTAGIWRKKAIIDAGGWQSDTIAEDLDLSYRAQLQGYRIKYLNDYTTLSQLPTSIQAFAQQQHRWSKGGFETAKKILPRLFSSPISWKKKTAALHHLLSPLLYISTLLIALIFPLLQMPLFKLNSSWLKELASYTDLFLVISFITFLIHTFSLRKDLIPYLYFLSLVIGLSIQNTLGIFDVMKGKKSPFVRTPKSEEQSLSEDVMNKSFSTFTLPFATTMYFFLSFIYLLYLGRYPALIFTGISLVGFAMTIQESFLNKETYQILSTIKSKSLRFFQGKKKPLYSSSPIARRR